MQAKFYIIEHTKKEGCEKKAVTDSSAIRGYPMTAQFLTLVFSGICAAAEGPKLYRVVRLGLRTLKSWWVERGSKIVRRWLEKLIQLCTPDE